MKNVYCRTDDVLDISTRMIYNHCLIVGGGWTIDCWKQDVCFQQFLYDSDDVDEKVSAIREAEELIETEKEKRIIKEGRKPKIEVEETCERCGCVFRYTKGDLEYDPRDNESWVSCPCCGKAIVVNPLDEWWTPKQNDG